MALTVFCAASFVPWSVLSEPKVWMNCAKRESVVTRGSVACWAGVLVSNWLTVLLVTPAGSRPKAVSATLSSCALPVWK